MTESTQASNLTANNTDETSQAPVAVRQGRKRVHGLQTHTQGGLKKLATLEPVTRNVIDDATQREDLGKSEVIVDVPVPLVDNFDNDARANARAHLLQLQPQTALSQKYVITTQMVEDYQEELDTLRHEMRNLDDDQFSLENMRLYQAATALPLSDPKREAILNIIDTYEERKRRQRCRLAVRERHIIACLEELKQTLKELEIESLNERVRE